MLTAEAVWLLAYPLIAGLPLVHSFHARSLRHTEFAAEVSSEHRRYGNVRLPRCYRCLKQPRASQSTGMLAQMWIALMGVRVA